MKSFVIKRFRGLAQAALVLAFAGCADIHSYCKDFADCTGGDDNDEKACVAEMKGERAAADEYGCRDEFDRCVACYLEYGQCGTATQGVPNHASEFGVYLSAVDEETGTDMCASTVSAWSSCGNVESRSGSWK